MLRIASKLAFLALFTFFSGHLQAQNLGKVKAAISNMPQQIGAGETAKVTVTITNTGSTTWTSEYLHCKSLDPFEITKEWSNDWKLEPGQSTEVYYKVTAPLKAGKYKMRVMIYNGDKRIAYKTKKVEVTETSLR